MEHMETENLIDLSADDNLLLLDADPAPNNGTLPHVCNFIAPMNSNDSCENNPFDMVQKLATIPGDPFELVEHQARNFPQKSVQVKEGNLLSFSSDALLDVEEEKSHADSGFETPPLLQTLNNTIRSSGNRSMEQRKLLLKISLSNSTCHTPTGRNFSPFNMLADESPLKLVDDDLMSETPPEYASPSLDNDFEKDLRELQIPILKQLPSPVEDNQNNLIEAKNEMPTCSSSLPNLQVLREKLRAKRLEKQEQSSIKGIINSLKSLICDSDLPDVEKKQRASSLLETLSSCVENTESESKEAQKQVEKPPTPIKREGTFDLDLIKQEENCELKPGNLVQPLPEIMVSSSATYDGDNAEDKEHLHLPEVVNPDVTGIGTQFDLNELVEQLSKLLGQQKLSCSANDSTENQQTANPTVIVVMNTSTVNTLEDTQASRSAQAFRRRSQSLSLIDKVKIVQLPLPDAHAQMSEENEDQYLSPPIPKHMFNNESVLDSQFKTPARILRRNSFSSGTPVTHNSMLQKTRRLAYNQDKRQVTSALRTANFSMRPEASRGKTKTESIIKSSGPMKATIPLKKIAPTFKVKSPTQNKKFTNLDASMNFLHRPEQISCTSTPMPLMRSADHSMGSPIKRTKPRASLMPVTPTAKPAATHNTTPRRTISEFRTKSPIKSRIGVMGGISKPTASGRTTNVVQRTLNRLNVPTLSNGFKSVLGTNKENKRP